MAFSEHLSKHIIGLFPNAHFAPTVPLLTGAAATASKSNELPLFATSVTSSMEVKVTQGAQIREAVSHSPSFATFLDFSHCRANEQ